MVLYEFLEVGRKAVHRWEDEKDVPLYVPREKMFNGEVGGENDPADYAGYDEGFDI